MSFIVNPLSYRLNKTKFSKFNWINLSKNLYKKFFFEDKIIDKFYFWFKIFLKWIGFSIAILNYNILKFYKYFQFNIKIIIREENKINFFKNKKKKKKNFFIFDEIKKISEIKNVFKPIKMKLKTKKEKEEEQKRVFKNENYILAEKLLKKKHLNSFNILKKKKIINNSFLKNKIIKKKIFDNKKKIFNKNKFFNKNNFKNKNKFFNKNSKNKNIFLKKNILNKKNKNFLFLLLNENLKKNDLFFKFYILKKKKYKKKKLRLFFNYLKKLAKTSLNLSYLKKYEFSKNKFSKYFYYLKKRMQILKKMQNKNFILKNFLLNRFKKKFFYKNKFLSYFLNNHIFYYKFFFLKKINFFIKNNDYIIFFFSSFIKVFILHFLNNIFLHNKIILNFYNQTEFFNHSESLFNFLKMRILQKYQVPHILNLLFNNLKKKKSIIGIEIGLFGRYQKKLRNRNIWKLKGLIAPSNINSMISYKNFVVLLRYGVCGVKLYLLSKVYKNEIF